MTKTQELIEAARLRLGKVTDYSLGKTLEIPRPTMSEYVRGIRNADTYACVRIAMVLKRDPLEVIAEVEAQTARTPTKREFWSRFPSGLRRTTLGVVLSATCFGSVLVPRTGEAAHKLGTTSHNVY